MEPIVTRLVNRLASRNGKLMYGGVAVRTLAEVYGTPLFIYDRQKLDARYEALRAALPAEFEIYYSIKANPAPAVMRHFLLRGCGLEIASLGELRLAQAAGCPAPRIIFAGPGKTDRELEAAIDSQIGEIHIESENEAARISRLCRLQGKRARVSVRVNPGGEAQGGAMRMGGKPTPFGIDEEKLEGVVRQLEADECFDFRGIHMFSGTQILDHNVLANQYRRCIQIAERVVEITGHPLRTIDFGGGLGVPYFDAETELDLSEVRAHMTALVAELRADSRFRGTRLIVEPGRYLVAEAGIYVARIVDIKESKGKKFFVLDGGMNHHLAASGNLGQTIKRNYPIVLVEKLGQPAHDIVDIVGPLCTPLDTLGRSVALPQGEIGDLVGILQSGAYARSASPVGFLSHPSPAEVWVDGEEHCLIRPRGDVDSAHRDSIMPASLVASENLTVS